ncbi:hypothetical protein K503DRAFT_98692 [Rhizopogon vinicolor AM-OR11-026]|uniref:Uncharacterized protein n=1 Tax=Rhizopogon vinicolor AM-OR11-026 TaxID=1314800 RepID=A0A1B7N395_9AGAM|nr:hypothetical protein K503DRAFT_98692 [Rhizopogon vinicolor AM-OR11-026]
MPSPTGTVRFCTRNYTCTSAQNLSRACLPWYRRLNLVMIVMPSRPRCLLPSLTRSLSKVSFHNFNNGRSMPSLHTSIEPAYTSRFDNSDVSRFSISKPTTPVQISEDSLLISLTSTVCWKRRTNPGNGAVALPHAATYGAFEGDGMNILIVPIHSGMS